MTGHGARRATGSWNVKLSSAGYAPLALAGFLGGPGTIGFGADYDGDGLADPAIYTRADGTWTVRLTL